MGRLTYQEKSSYDIDDRLLAHLRIVMANKLRRGEPFMLQFPHPGQGHLSIWIHPSIPVILQFYGGREPKIDRDVIERMMAEASGPDGLTL